MRYCEDFAFWRLESLSTANHSTLKVFLLTHKWSGKSENWFGMFSTDRPQRQCDYKEGKVILVCKHTHPLCHDRLTGAACTYSRVFVSFLAGTNMFMVPACNIHGTTCNVRIAARAEVPDLREQQQSACDPCCTEVLAHQRHQWPATDRTWLRRFYSGKPTSQRVGSATRWILYMIHDVPFSKIRPPWISIGVRCSSLYMGDELW